MPINYKEEFIMSKEYITAKEAAKRLGVCHKTMLRTIKTGKYQTVVLNKRPLLIWDIDAHMLVEVK